MVWCWQERTWTARRSGAAHRSRKSGLGLPINDHDVLQVFPQRMIPRTLAARRHGISIHDLVAERAVDQQTSWRELKNLKMLAHPLEEAEGARGRKVWRSPRNDGCPPLQFTFDEAVALSPVRPSRKPQAELSRLKATPVMRDSQHRYNREGESCEEWQPPQ
jgi:hypothetical protein